MDKYIPKGYRVSINKTIEAETNNALSYIHLFVTVITVLSYFFFDNWLLELIFTLVFLSSLKIAFLHYLVDEALKQERTVTNEEFARIHEEIKEMKEKIV